MTDHVVVPVMPEEKKRHAGLGLKGLGQVFVNPSQLFAKIKEDPKVLAPYLALAGAIILMLWLLADYILDMQMQSEPFRRQMEAQGLNLNSMPAGFREMMKWNIIGFGSLASLLVPLLIAGLALFWGNFVFAGRAGFKAILSVTLFGEFLYWATSYLVLPLVFAKDSILVSFSLAALHPNPNITSMTYMILSKISLSHVWEVVVLGIGFSIIFDLSRNKGLWIAVLSMGLLAIIHAVTSGLGIG